jgi:hypothetical protein
LDRTRSTNLVFRSSEAHFAVVGLSGKRKKVTTNDQSVTIGKHSPVPMAESMAKIKTTHCQFRREVSRTLNIPYAIRDCIVVPNANIDCQIAETIGCSDRLYHWTVIVMRQGLKVDSKKPIRARLARIGGTVLLKASQKQSCSRQLESAARSFDPYPSPDDH